MTEPDTDPTSALEPNGYNDGGEDFVFTPEELVDWVEGLVAMLESVDRSQNQYWCAQWWNHPEAVDPVHEILRGVRDLLFPALTVRFRTTCRIAGGACHDNVPVC